MANPAQPTMFSSKHLNRGLFSDYYLNDIAPTLQEWKDDNGLFAEALKLREELRALLKSIHPETLNESQLEDQWVKPILEKLGHHWSVQVMIRYRDKGYRKPDYMFTNSIVEANAFSSAIYTPEQLVHALALGDAKRWGTPLDQSSGKDKQNPSEQIDEYLRHSELTWGILTDGRYWRLYHHDSSIHNRYYAVDLPALLLADDLHDFYYFLLFFRQEAFVKDKEGWLEKVLKGSTEFAEKLSEDLEDEVYFALEQLAQGFLNYRRNRLKPDTTTLKTVYEQSLVLLYRLLFVLYAESRDVLPMSTNADYAGYRSLRALSGLVKNKIEGETRVNKMAVDEDPTYASLSALFFAIDVGDPEYGVAPYNGRLFSDEEHPFLADKSIGDAFLVPAIDRLTRIKAKVRGEATPRKVFVDYRDLDVRHLGAIYEKLLEYQLDMAETDLSVKGGKYVPYQAGDERIKKAGEVYLKGGNNERKVTGSYYTPDYIVRFIVEQTLEPLLNEITQQYAALDAEGHWQVSDGEPLRKAILNINILDPATGSGHFMVEAVAYIAEWLRRLRLQPADLEVDEDELVYWKRQVVTTCIYGVDVNPLAVELAKLSLWLTTIQRGKPLSFLNHHVQVGNTLVGYKSANPQILTPPLRSPLYYMAEGEQSPSIRPQAMEGEEPPPQPSPASDGGSKAQQLALFEDAGAMHSLSAAVAKMSGIENALVANVKDVKAQEEDYAELKAALEPLVQVANYWTSQYFSASWNPNSLKTFLDVASKGQTVEADDLEKLAEEHHFFHWELAFPEVFFTPDGQRLAEGGFDAVIGNPPYVRQERIIPIKTYLEANYEVYAGTADLFLYFYERALKLVKPSRRIGYITSGTFMNSNSAVKFRKYLHEQAAFETVVNFGENQPFKGAEMVYPTMAILRNGKPEATFRSLFVEKVYHRNELGDAIHDLPMVDTSSDVTALDEWRFQSVELTALFKKVTQGYQHLGDAVKGRMYRGVVTGYNDAFIIDEATRKQLVDEHPSSAEIIKPMLKGEDLRPWYQLESGHYLIFTRRGIALDNYPAIKAHLEKYRNYLEPKPDSWNDKRDGDWEGRKAGLYQWYEIQDNIAYHEEFNTPKILMPDIGKLPRFSWDEEDKFSNDKGTIIVPPNKSLLAILNSRVLWFALSQTATPLRLRAGLWQYQAKIQFVERLPIPELSAAQELGLAEQAEAITALAKERYQLDEAMRKRLAADLGAGGKLNAKLENWWDLDFATLRAEVKKAFKGDIPVGERDEWEKYLAERQAKHDAATNAIIAREKTLNAIVYAAFKLTADEIGLIEQATKYPDGAV